MLQAVLAVAHEPWRDEADAWLVARDATPPEILGLTGAAGTPSLWYWTLLPFAKVGLPYGAMKAIQGGLAAGAASLLVLRSPFALWECGLLLFGYFLGYEYGVVARSYTLTVLLLFAVASFWRERRETPWPLHGALFLLANTNAHGFLMAGVLHVGLALPEPGPRRHAAPWALSLAGLGLAFWQLIPPSDGQIQLSTFRHPDIEAVARCLRHPFFGAFETGWLAFPGILLALLALARLIARPRLLIVLGGLWGSLLALFLFKYVGGLRHYGLLLLALVFCLWIERDGRAASPSGWSRVVHRAFAVLFPASLAVSAASLALTARAEVLFQFSDAGDMASYLLSHGLAERPVAAFPAPHTASVLPYLPKRTFYYPGLGRSGSFMTWGRTLFEDEVLSPADAIARIPFALPDPRGTLLLTNKRLAPPLAASLRLLHRTPGFLFAKDDERFFLYGNPERYASLPAEAPAADIFHAELALSEPVPTTMVAASDVSLRVRVQNASPEPWPSDPALAPRERVHLSYHWRSPAAEPLPLPEPARITLSRTLRPGDAEIVSCRLRTPDAAGQYLLELDLVEENVAWFSEKGSKPLRVQVVVTAR